MSHSHWGLFIRRPSFRLSGSFFFFLTGHYITTDKWTHLFSLLFARRELSVFLSSYSRKREREKCWSSWFALWMKWRGAGHRILEDNLSTPPRDTHTVPPWLLLQFCESSEAPYADHSPGCWSQVFPWMLFPNGLEGGKKIWIHTRENRRRGFSTLSLTSGLTDCSNRTKSIYHQLGKSFCLALIP